MERMFQPRPSAELAPCRWPVTLTLAGLGRSIKDANAWLKHFGNDGAARGVGPAKSGRKNGDDTPDSGAGAGAVPGGPPRRGKKRATIRLTAARARVRFLAPQGAVLDGVEVPLFAGCCAIFGHGN